MIRLVASMVMIVSLMLLVPRPTMAIDESESLTLLVATLERVEDEATQSALLQGMLSGLEGRRNVPAPEGWKKVAARFSKSEQAAVRELTAQLSQIFGDETVTRQSLATVQNRSAPVTARKRALHALLTQRNDRVSELLEALLDEPDFQLDAIRGFAAIENAKAPEILLQRYDRFPAALQKAILETLATRKPYAEALLNAIEADAVPRSHVPAHVARSLSFLLGEAFVEVFGDVRQLSKDRTVLMEKYRKLLSDEALASADAAKGRVVYDKTCASCHVLYGTGGKIGPDLTGSNRANLDYLLLNSVDPSYDVPEGYKMVSIQTVDGRVLNGVIAEEDAQRVVLKTVEQPTVVILKRDIETRQVSPKSMMPDGQLEQMKRRDIIDLVKYLQTTEQVELPQ